MGRMRFRCRERRMLGVLKCAGERGHAGHAESRTYELEEQRESGCLRGLDALLVQRQDEIDQ
jgi:hypothetical protein